MIQRVSLGITLSLNPNLLGMWPCPSYISNPCFSFFTQEGLGEGEFLSTIMTKIQVELSIVPGSW